MLCFKSFLLLVLVALLIGVNQGQVAKEADVIVTPEAETIAIETTFIETPVTPFQCEGIEKPLEDSPCGGCTCINNEWACTMAACMRPPCVDAVTKPGQCCGECPNGPNCYIDGVLVPMDQDYVRPDGSVCFCQYNSWETEVLCIPPFTTPPGCEGLQKPVDDGPCSFCSCEPNWLGQFEWSCIVADCMVPKCVDAVREPGQCCEVCPNGPNCYIDGVLVSMNQDYVRPDGSVCYCEEGSPWEQANIICTPPRDTTTPAGCEGQDKPFEDGPCGGCMCDNWSGEYEWICYMASCMMPNCVDPVKKPDQCCEECPNGPNCYIDDVIVPMGQEYVRSDGSVCFCQQNEPWQQADVICMPPFKTPAGCESQEKPWDSPCVTCDCVDWSGAGNADWVCWMTDCFPAPCVDKVSVPNECCETCPNGPNCETFGEIIPLGVNKTINGLECHCEYTFILEAPIAVCNPILTTTLETITPSPISSTTKERTTLKQSSTTTSETITPSPISSSTKERTTLKQSSTTTSEKTTPNKNRKRISANSNES